MGLFKANYKSLSDEELMSMVAKGDQRAFNFVYDRYAGMLVNYFYRMLWKDREKAEDFMHDLFSKVIHKPHLYDPNRPFKTWMFSVANNMCKNEYKKQEVRKNTRNGLDETYQGASSNRNSEDLMDDGIYSNAIQDAIDQLDEKHRTVFVLKHFEEMSIKEIAEACDCNEGTVKSRIFYATKKLSDMLSMYKEEMNIKS